MDYVLLAYADNALWNALTTAERDAIQTACAANDEWLRRRGHLLAVVEVEGRNRAPTRHFARHDIPDARLTTHN